MNRILFFSKDKQQFEKFSSLLEGASYRLFFISDIQYLLTILHTAQCAIVDSRCFQQESAHYLTLLHQRDQIQSLLVYVSSLSDPFIPQLLVDGVCGILSEGFSKEMMSFVVKKACEHYELRALSCAPMRSQSSGIAPRTHQAGCSAECCSAFLTHSIVEGMREWGDESAIWQVFLKLLKTTSLNYLVWNKKSHLYEVRYTSHLSPEIAAALTFPVHDGLVPYIQQYGKVKAEDSATPVNVRNDIYLLGGESAVGMIEGGMLTGVFILGRKIDGSSVSADELQWLTFIGHKMSLFLNTPVSVRMTPAELLLSAFGADDSSMGIAVIDKDAKICSINAYACTVLKLDTQRVIGYDIDVLPEQIAGLVCDVQATGQELSGTVIHLPLLHLALHVCIRKLSDAKEGDIMLFFIDMTNSLKRVTEHGWDEKVKFIHTVAERSSHELKNCLVSIRTFTELLPEKYIDEQFRNDFYCVMNKEVVRLSDLVENLLFFSQEFDPQLHMVDCGRLLEEVYQDIAKDHDVSRVRFNNRLINKGIMLEVDRLLIKKALFNIIKNAVQASGEEGIIHCTGRTVDLKNGEKKATFLLYIDDEGQGMNEELVAKACDPFFTTKSRGLGLGLTIARKIVQAHGGEIEVSNKKEKKGLRISIRIPCLIIENDKDSSKKETVYKMGMS